MRAELGSRRSIMRETRVMSSLLKRACKHWPHVEPLLRMPLNDEEYRVLVRALNQLLDIVGDNELHPLEGLLSRLGDNIAAYDKKHFPMPSSSPGQVLQYLMTERALGLDDLPEIASAEGIADLLSGRRRFTRRQIRALSTRFGVSSAVFL